MPRGAPGIVAQAVCGAPPCGMRVTVLSESTTYAVPSEANAIPTTYFVAWGPRTTVRLPSGAKRLTLPSSFVVMTPPSGSAAIPVGTLGSEPHGSVGTPAGVTLDTVLRFALAVYRLPAGSIVSAYGCGLVGRVTHAASTVPSGAIREIVLSDCWAE